MPEYRVEVQMFVNGKDEDEAYEEVRDGLDLIGIPFEILEGAAFLIDEDGLDGK